MKQILKNSFICIIITMLVFSMFGCSSSNNGNPNPEKIVPNRETLIKNLEESGYTITTLSSIDGSDLTIDRVMAQKKDQFIDIVYGLSNEEAPTIFKLYCELYPEDYYILAQNGNYIYCVSDKKTFSKAGFTTTDNVGEQYINNN